MKTNKIKPAVVGLAMIVASAFAGTPESIEKECGKGNNAIGQVFELIKQTGRDVVLKNAIKSKALYMDVGESIDSYLTLELGLTQRKRITSFYLDGNHVKGRLEYFYSESIVDKSKLPEIAVEFEAEVSNDKLFDFEISSPEGLEYFKEIFREKKPIWDKKIVLEDYIVSYCGQRDDSSNFCKSSSMPIAINSFKDDQATWKYQLIDEGKTAQFIVKNYEIENGKPKEGMVTFDIIEVNYSPLTKKYVEPKIIETEVWEYSQFNRKRLSEEKF